MDDPDLGALLDELGSEGSEDESAFERTLDDILGDDGDDDELWGLDPEPIKHVRVVDAHHADAFQKVAQPERLLKSEHAENAAGEGSANKAQKNPKWRGEGVKPPEDPAPAQSASVLGSTAGLLSPPKQAFKKSLAEVSGGQIGPEARQYENGSVVEQAQVREKVVYVETRAEIQSRPMLPAMHEPFSKSTGSVPPPLAMKDKIAVNSSRVKSGSSVTLVMKAHWDGPNGEKQRTVIPEPVEAVSTPLQKQSTKSLEQRGQSTREPHLEKGPETATMAPAKELQSSTSDIATMQAELRSRERVLEKLLEDNVQETGMDDKKSTGGGGANEQQQGSEGGPDLANSLEEKLERQPSALQIAEELERLRSSSGAHLEEGAAAQPMQLEGAWAGPPAIGVLRVEEVETLSAALGTSIIKRDHGEPQALALHPNFIAVGLSRGGVLVAPGRPGKEGAHQSQSKAFVLGGGGQVACTALDMYLTGELLLAGYSDGSLVLWDVQRAAPARASFGVGADEHAAGCPITHVRFLAALPDQPRNSRAVTADAKGIVMLHTFSSVPILRRYTVVSQRLLDGSQAIGPVLDLKPLNTFEPSHPPQSPPSVSIPTSVNSPRDESESSARGQKGAFTPRQSFSEAGAMSPKPAGTPAAERAVGRFDKGLDMGRKVLVDAGLDKSLDMGRKFLFDAVNTAADAGKVIAGAGPVKGVAEDLIEKGLVAMLTGSTILVALLAEKMQVLVRMPRPDSVREGAVPYCAWRKPRHWPSFQTPETSARTSDALPETSKSEAPEAPRVSTAEEDRFRRPPLLALGWDRTVLICRLGRGGLRVLARWKVQNPDHTDGKEPADIIGIVWLGDDIIGVLTGREEMCIYWVTTGEEVERFMIGVQGGEEAAVSHSHYTNSIGSSFKAYHNSVGARGPAMFVLGPSGLKVGRLLHWKERLEGLKQAGDWLGAFHAAMELYDGKAKGVLGVPPTLDSLHAAIMPTLLSLLTAYIDEAMAYVGLSLGTNKAEPSEPSPGVSQYAGVGGVAIEFCVHIGRPEVLFEDVFDKFMAVGHQGTFLELLEPYILKDTLRGLAPAVMQALVEHYSEKGWLQRVEQCILHMNIASLDFNQVVRLCRQHMLYSALIYVFSSGLDDFVTPLEELLAVAQDTESAHARAFGYKLLVYLKHCFLGLAFPPGNGSLDPARLPSLRSELVHFLLAAESTAPPKTANESDANRDAGRTALEESTENGVDALPLRFPRLCYLLGLDTEAGLRVLEAAFPETGPLGVGRSGRGFKGDSDEVSGLTDQGQGTETPSVERSPEMEERLSSNEEASTSSPERAGLRKAGSRLGRRLFKGVGAWRGGDSPSTAAPGSTEGPVQNLAEETPELDGAYLRADGSDNGDALVQIVVDALMDVSREAIRRGVSLSEEREAREGGANQTDVSRMLRFCARFIATGHASISLELLAWLIRQLCGAPSDLSTNSVTRPNGFPAKPVRQTEQSSSGLIEWLDARSDLAQNQKETLIVALLKGALGLPKPADGLEGFDTEGLLPVMEGLGFWEAAALLHAAQGHFSEALDSLLKDRSHAAQTFAFVNKYLGEESSGGAHAENLRRAVLSRLPSLVRLDASAAACIVANHLASDNDQVLKALAPFPDLQFAYLKGIVTAKAVEAAPGVGGPGTSQLGDLLQRAGIEVTDEVAETYVGLMCRFEPGSVLPFLEGHQAYRLEQCLALCQQFGVTDASAYLLERMGDVGAALNLVLSQVTSKMAALDEAVSSHLSDTPQTSDEDAQALLSDLPELPAAEKALDVAVALCQRNTQRMDPRETEALWFRLVRQYMDPLRSLKEGAVQRGGRAKGLSWKESSSSGIRRDSNVEGERQNGVGGKERADSVLLKCAGNAVATRALRRVLARFISAIMFAMMGHVPLATILNKILQDHGGDEFGDFKGTILGMLGTFGYERAILGTARDLIEDDTWQSLDQLKRLRLHGLAPNRLTCCVCQQQLNEKPPQKGGEGGGSSKVERGTDKRAGAPSLKGRARRARNHTEEKLPAIQVYACGHVAHATCSEEKGPDCPVCDPPGKVSTSNGRNPGKRPVVEEAGSSDGAVGVLGGVQQQGSPSQRSRLALLRDLDRGKDIYGRSEALQLAPPPAVQTQSYVERRPGRMPRQAVYSSSADVFGLSSGATQYSSPIDEDDLT